MLLELSAFSSFDLLEISNFLFQQVNNISFGIFNKQN